MLKLLLIDDDGDHAEQLGRELAQRRLAVIRAADCGEAVTTLRNREHICDIVILTMTGRSRAWLAALHDLQRAGQEAGFLEVPLFLCTSRQQFGVDFQLQVERMGARYACEE
jgi:ActR/RegA family two-component response regulator